MTQVKICGLSDEAGCDAAVEHGADWLGFVFFAKSPRAVDPARAAALSARYAGGPGRVGLFVRADDDAIRACLDRVRLDALQIYDTAERAAVIRARFGVPVWLACGVGDAADLPVAALADRMLLESRPPAGGDRPGGNATRLDWQLLADWQAPGPWMLAGGLDPGNVSQAMRVTRAPAVDVSSGVEFEPGRKDPARIAAFLGAVRAADRA
ncbi:phosphoribosylanthranilate isomerase [Lichenicoccus sp.]|uniref:phosphoribosylanthranilate isomerase n=1 Tax=Lichenicoccus sp. TaxID=2781899 RepID=UPI003D132FAC